MLLLLPFRALLLLRLLLLRLGQADTRLRCSNATRCSIGRIREGLNFDYIGFSPIAQ